MSYDVSGMPKYVAAAQAIATDIAKGRYVGGDRIPSETQLGRKLGMARMTVRQAVGRLVTEGVLERRPGVGTFVRPGVGKGCNLALLCFRVGNASWSTLARMELEGIQGAARLRGVQVRGMMMVKPLPPPEQVLSELRHMRVGAVAVYGFDDHDRDYIRYISQHIPCMLLNKELPGLPLPCAKPDLMSGIRQIVDHFVGLGRTRIGVLVTDSAHAQHRQVVWGVEAELQRRGLPVDKRFWFEGTESLSCDEAFRWVERVLSAEDPPEAIVVNEVRRSRPTLVERIALAGRDIEVVEICDHVDLAAQRPPWTVLRLDHERVARDAQEMLLDMLDAGEASIRVPIRVSPVELLLAEDKVAEVAAAAGEC